VKSGRLIAAAVIAGAFAAPALAQTTESITRRNVNQQERFEQGLKSGQLTTREASKLEGEEARVDKMESQALDNGKLSPKERARINQAQDKVSGDIYRDKHNAQVGNPNSAKRLPAPSGSTDRAPDAVRIQTWPHPLVLVSGRP